jgi:hypothetical protein
MNLVQLTRKDHAGLRLDPARALDAAATVHLVPLVASEIRKVASQFPVFLAKDGETGQFYPAALLGLEPQENLFWDGTTLDADHVPLNLLRLPFFVGSGPLEGQVCIDSDSAAIVADGPVGIVEADGSDSAYLQSVQAILGQLVAEQGPTAALVALITEHRLVSEVTLDVAFHNGTSASLSGLYGIDERALGRKAAVLGDWDQVMVLAAMALSLDHVAGLVRRKNARLAAEAAWFAPAA